MGTIRRNRSSRPAAAGPARRPKRARGANDTLTNQMDRLYDEARRDPRSDAGCMVRAFVLSGIRSSEARPYEEGASGVAMGRERQRDRQASRRLAEKFKTEARQSSARIGELEREIQEHKARLQDLAKAAQEALDAKLGSAYICRRIAEAVGLCPPSGESVEPEQPQDPMPKGIEPFSD